ncbi:hypothetical protein PPYC1_11535 [Paenibacillus polymyxa]|uniref:hypothetical protein n=1 Tax=Paenibacillus TaxID=44249 RepID=UPI0008FCC77D|nr:MULTISPECIES: hypothetical protein [Paenibacillus]APB70957.1 hypothetical protein PPYC1_11535 [Paenibacillus polymyxa]OMF49368.1 hypothetical protein BK135_08805 [Paenibacillus peoriae]
MAQVIRVLESFIHDLEEGETEMSEFGNVFGPNELKELLELAKRGNPPQQPDIKRNDKVTHTEHPEWGWGKVILIKDATGPEAGILFSNHKGTDGYYPFDKLQKVEGEEV